ncbi:response regulator [Pedobacter changchengzhani]|uniref:Response regulator n=1 Tax=Pedobacter changchengzhani TaxID=2529274 RepID=A0A4R5MH47_9SPHI|nr:response regulator [Pedobacter changchengzhani]TDG34847.1 response regulator [Pedobacter changchengzhani]
MKKVYVLEDNDDIREIIEFLLVDGGYNFTGFPNAKSFFQGIEGNTPDIFILDIMLPDGNGLDICRDLKERQDTKNVPVLMMSANTDMMTTKNRCKAEDFISKPFDIDDFVGRVDHLLKDNIAS